MNYTNRPAPPTSSLPPLNRLSAHSLSQVTNALDNLRILYFPPPSPPRRYSLRNRALQHRHLIHDDSVPDSGYASAEEDDEDTGVVEEVVEIPVSLSVEGEGDGEEPFDIDVLRSDTFERAFAIKWLTAFTARADVWISTSPIEEDERTQAVDDAANILSSFVGAEPEQALTRTFSFPFLGSKADTIEVELNDAPLLSGDHTSVGLQSWASSIILSERMCAQPATFRLDANSSRSGGRILELGAGTGLLSISAAKILQRYGALENTTIVATDFHPDVLANLRRNVDTNFTSFHNAIDVRCLDWEHPDLTAPSDKPFDIILAADVVYHPSHAAWIKACVYSLLAKPTATGAIGGVFWLIVALRASGRHEGVANTVNDVFPSVQDVRLSRSSEWELAVLHQQRLERQGGIGRADEGGYKLFEIGWVRS